MQHRIGQAQARLSRGGVLKLASIALAAASCAALSFAAPATPAWADWADMTAEVNAALDSEVEGESDTQTATEDLESHM